jgi:hypothetical protein
MLRIEHGCAQEGMPTMNFDDAAEAIDAIIDNLKPADQLRMLGVASGFALSLVDAADRAQARDRLVELIDHTSRDAVLSRCDG